MTVQENELLKLNISRLRYVKSNPGNKKINASSQQPIIIHLLLSHGNHRFWCNK